IRHSWLACSSSPSLLSCIISFFRSQRRRGELNKFRFQGQGVWSETLGEIPHVCMTRGSGDRDRLPALQERLSPRSATHVSKPPVHGNPVLLREAPGFGEELGRYVQARHYAT